MYFYDPCKPEGAEPTGSCVCLVLMLLAFLASFVIGLPLFLAGIFTDDDVLIGIGCVVFFDAFVTIVVVLMYLIVFILAILGGVFLLLFLLLLSVMVIALLCIILIPVSPCLLYYFYVYNREGEENKSLLNQ